MYFDDGQAQDDVFVYGSFEQSKNDYAVALNSTGENERAVKTLTDAVTRFPYNREMTNALMQFSQQSYMLAKK
ncbi:hypothetical protein EOPP23_09370 [Endozoicomonas sp. OPT23]|uniref:hypothetical protein n=1 Tax=Endozoicomonas sp. OPT23 TaxID=2072845 RepID=UPI00129BACF4|nr:hypothetical protein [Endozoicomonas sp. OPT23]MRI33192.1 hypothetical protein [Endozoicomonas sp. OPT23]